MSRKRQRQILVAVCLIGSYGPSLAKEKTYDGWGSSFYSGEELSRLCKSNDPLEQRECSSYICGVFDGFATLYFLGQLPRDRNMPFDLEMITRDPLKIPVFTEKYWATFDDSQSPLPGRDLARVLEIVQRNKPKSQLPRTTGLSSEAYLKLEDECVLKSIRYARQHLDL